MGSTRNPAAPEIPTFRESGYPAVDVSLWQGVYAPARTPAPIIRKLSVSAASASKAISRPTTKPAGAFSASAKD